MTKLLAKGAALLALCATPAMANDWSGFYAGAGAGMIEVDTTVEGVKESDPSYGIHGGYRHDLGQWVVGGEIEHDWTDVELIPGAITADRVMRLKATAGYDFGPALVYVAAGTAKVNVDGLGDDWGGFYGLGAAYAVGARANVSLELLEHNFSDIGGSGIDADAWSGNLRVSWKF
ncbi:outer membrane beta-barrel protein [Paracoccus tibetensis]|uniref:Opacity protein n=1 Tax=Paracoccus tibetensis TaxID=336292 RepID=A0A1G5CXP9_9RHOB|nr:outer membrane beta-barrel protein [Paracoccus tibetensis]SCY07194.1 Opacity protein [Paracoccus tibetensis]